MPRRALAPTIQRIAALARPLRWLGGLAPSLLSIGGLAITCTLLGLAWTTINPIIEQISRVESSRLPRLELLQKARYADLDASVALRNVLLIRDRQLNTVEMQRYAQSSQTASAALEAFGESAELPREIELLQSTLTARRALKETRALAVESDRRGSIASEIDSLTGRMQDALDFYLAALQRLNQFQGAQVTSLVDAMAARADQTSVLLIASGIASAITMLFLAGSWRSEMRKQVTGRDRQIASLKTQRDALVREVHHRIKNHLQGLLGLFEAHQLSPHPPASGSSLATLHGHVLALVGIHGLQSKDLSESISVRDLVCQQVELVRLGFPGSQVAAMMDANLETARLSADQSVPVALVVTELMVNAIKHGAAAPVRISIGVHDGHAYVSVTNRLNAPTKLDWSGQRGLGTGLRLIATLLQGIARIDQKATPDELVMTVELVADPEQPPM